MLNDRQRRFAEVYLECGVAAQAAKAAGYRPDYGYALLKNPQVLEHLQKVKEENERQEVAGSAEVLGFLTNVMREGKGPAAMKAAELLGRRMGLFSEQDEELPAPVIVDDLMGEEE